MFPVTTCGASRPGIDHVEPPESILQSMVSLRLQIDDCGHDNGPLLALRGSFRLGRVSASEIKRHVTGHATEVCCANAGDVVAMRGLTIHASERALRPSHRRVIHVDFSSAELPCGLEWALAQPDAGHVKELRGEGEDRMLASRSPADAAGNGSRADGFTGHVTCRSSLRVAAHRPRRCRLCARSRRTARQAHCRQARVEPARRGDRAQRPLVLERYFAGPDRAAASAISDTSRSRPDTLHDLRS